MHSYGCTFTLNSSLKKKKWFNTTRYIISLTKWSGVELRLKVTRTQIASFTKVGTLDSLRTKDLCNLYGRKSACIKLQSVIIYFRTAFSLLEAETALSLT